MKWDWLKNEWMNNANVLAQIGHALGGYAVVLTTAFITGHVLTVLMAAVAMATYAAIKEFWYDANFEIPKQTWVDNTTDFFFYIVGISLGLLVTYLKIH